MNQKDILVTGGSGMLGAALKKIIPNAIFVSSDQYDLKNAKETDIMFQHYQPKFVIHLAAKVGGVSANYNHLADFYYDNILINTNTIHYAYLNGVKKFVSMLSTCVYPDDATYSLTEDQIHDGSPHYSNFGYAYAKRMLDVQSRAYRKQYGCNFITAIPNNLFGENDSFDLEDSHVLPAIIRKVYEATLNNEKQIEFWGDGSPEREFTYSGDVAEILLFLLSNYDLETPINIGNTNQYKISEIVNKVVDIFDYNGIIKWNVKRPSGQQKKPSSNSKLLSLGWNDYTNFDYALRKTCEWFVKNYPNCRGIRRKK